MPIESLFDQSTPYWVAFALVSVANIWAVGVCTFCFQVGKALLGCKKNRLRLGPGGYVLFVISMFALWALSSYYMTLYLSNLRWIWE